MLKFLSILFIVIFVVPFLLRAIVSYLFGHSSQQNRPRQNRTDNTSSTSRAKKSPPKKKVISENEGEYVDYVEIKD
jgi:hypothetical protein